MSVCKECKHVKELDTISGRCLQDRKIALFCKLNDSTHVCDHYRKKKIDKG